MTRGKTMISFIILLGVFLLFKGNATFAAEDPNDGGIPILLYHHILKQSENATPDNLNIISLEAFEEQMQYLHDQGYYTATLSELGSYLRGELSLPSKTVVITFDDGLKTNYVYAYPVLKKYGFKAAAFLITNRITAASVPFNPAVLQPLSWPEINEMKDVFEFGSHTHGLHYLINGTPAILVQPEQDILQDLRTSRGLLNTEFLAYPFGGYNQSTIDLLKAAGFNYGFTTQAVNVKAGDNPYELGRKLVYPTTSLEKFKNLIKSDSVVKGWSNVAGKMYYYDENGNKKTSWFNEGDKLYYFDADGVMQTGWVTIENKKYYFDSNGVMQTGWLNQGDKQYYLDVTGVMQTGWLQLGDAWYYLQPSGEMQTGWLQLGDNLYYLQQNGMMQTGWLQLGQDWYYFYHSGYMASSTTVYGSSIGPDGKWIH